MLWPFSIADWILLSRRDVEGIIVWQGELPVIILGVFNGRCDPPCFLRMLTP